MFSISTVVPSARCTLTQVSTVAERVGFTYEGEVEHFVSAQSEGIGIRVIRDGSRNMDEMIVGLLAILKAGGAYVPLDPVYPVVFFDALRVKIRDEGIVKNKAVYVALALNPDGEKEVLGLWIEQTEGAKFWLKVINDLKTRGVNDILIAVVDGLKGFPEAIASVYPQTVVQTCIVHLIRNSLDYAGWKDRKLVAQALRPIYTAVSEQAARDELQAFAQGPWGIKYPTIVQSWTRAWEHVTPFFVFPPDIRRVIYTTNAIESINAQLRKIIKTRGHFPSDDAASKLIWLALRNITADWGRAAHNWKEAMNQFAILYEERFTRVPASLG